MVEKVVTSARNIADRNVIDFVGYQLERTSRAKSMVARACRHCSASLLDGESEDDCSSAGFGLIAPPPPRRFYVE